MRMYLLYIFWIVSQIALPKFYVVHIVMTTPLFCLVFLYFLDRKIDCQIRSNILFSFHLRACHSLNLKMIVKSNWKRG